MKYEKLKEYIDQLYKKYKPNYYKEIDEETERNLQKYLCLYDIKSMIRRLDD